MSHKLSVIGIMSGTSLDGIDLAYVQFDLTDPTPAWELQAAKTLDFSEEWKQRLTAIDQLPVQDFLAQDRAFGQLLGTAAKQWWIEKKLPQPDLIAAHGYTISHQPSKSVSHQLGHGATMAANAGVPVVVDFRSSDMAYGGQGAPLAPMGDEILFPGYQAYLNLGGIVNIYLPKQQLGFDITGCNLLLNALARLAGKPYDKNGQIAQSGRVRQDLLHQLEAWSYHHQAPPKSLHAGEVIDNLWPVLQQSAYSIADRLQTTAAWIGKAIGQVGAQYAATDDRLLITGGGAHHPAVIDHIQRHWPGKAEVAKTEWVDYKEAILFAYFGAMRWLKRPYVISNLTGATKDTVGGAVYLP